jgi:hypothetical protein
MMGIPKTFLQSAALLAVAALAWLAVYCRSDGPATIAAFGAVLLIAVPVSGLACLAAALFSTRVRESVSRHPIVYITWATAGVVVICIIVSAVVRTANLRYGH